MISTNVPGIRSTTLLPEDAKSQHALENGIIWNHPGEWISSCSREDIGQ